VIRSVALILCLTASLLPARGTAMPVDYAVHSGHFEKNDSGLKGVASYLLLDNRKSFEKIFGVAFTAGPKPNIVAADAFTARSVVAVIKRGGEVWDYKVEGVTSEEDRLTVRYTATAKDGSGARFASPLVVSVPKKAYKQVLFIENGQQVGEATRLAKDDAARTPFDFAKPEIASDKAVSGSAVVNAEPPSKTFTYKTIPGGTLEMVVSFPTGWKDTDKRPAIVFFFGGGWENGTVGAFQRQPDHLARRGMVAARADYRVKSRQGVNPDKCVEDAKSAVRWLRAHASTLGIDPNRIVAAGGSAGGHIAACTALTEGLEAEGEDQTVSSKPNALVLFNPVLRFHGSPQMMKRIDNDEAISKAISPTLNVSKDTPPTLLFFGTEDWLQGQGKEFMKRSTEVGFRAEMFTAEGQGHGFFHRPPWLERTIARMDQFLISLGYLKPAGDVAAEKS
jgi:acetyl esterase